MLAITILTGARDNATASLRLKHLDLADRQLYQDARQVRTKFGKSFPTWFFPVGEDFVAIVAEWRCEVEQVHGCTGDDPLVPKTEVAFRLSGEVLPARSKKEGWANADPMREVFKEACKAAALPNFKPHSFRDTLADLADEFCTTPGQFKAWSQNLENSDVLVTLTSYGTVPSNRQRDIILRMASQAKAASEP